MEKLYDDLYYEMENMRLYLDDIVSELSVIIIEDELTRKLRTASIVRGVYRKVMKSGGGGHFGLHISCCSLHFLGGLEACPPCRKVCALRQLLVQSEAKICLTAV